MGYKILAFDGVELPEELVDGNEQNMGTGQALTSFQQLPGGGFYDNYGALRSPQGIRPIVKSGILWGDTPALLKMEIDELRKKLGRRGKLTIQFDDLSLRWQWARLTVANIPRPAQAVQYWLPYELQWVTAAQHWYGVTVNEAAWTWGDLSWTFGDGTAEIGESGTTTTLTATGATFSGATVTANGTPQDITVDHGGNIPATNIAMSITAGASVIHNLRYQNLTSGYGWAYTLNLLEGDTVTIHAGAMSVLEGLTSRYGNFTPDNRAIWDRLAPGENTIRFFVDGNETADALMGWEFYDHYA